MAETPQTRWLRCFKASGCVVCGIRYPAIPWEHLHVDHIDPSAKTMESAQLGRLSYAVVINELLGCQVLCKAHHNGKHRGELPEPPPPMTEHGQLLIFTPPEDGEL